MRYFEKTIEIPEGCKVSIENKILSVTGPKGTVERFIQSKLLKYEIKDNEIIFYADLNKLNCKKIVLTFAAHLNNMFKGVQDGHVYKLKVCSGHFPMSVAVKGNKFEVKNFIGESKPRTLNILPDVDVKVKDSEIIVESIIKEKAGQMAASIEQLTRRPAFDKRIFQDGIYIIEKDGKKIEE
jgi:large subunit ribosomal protein L6